MTWWKKDVSPLDPLWRAFLTGTQVYASLNWLRVLQGAGKIGGLNCHGEG